MTSLSLPDARGRFFFTLEENQVSERSSITDEHYVPFLSQWDLGEISVAKAPRSNPGPVDTKTVGGGNYQEFNTTCNVGGHPEIL